MITGLTLFILFLVTGGYETFLLDPDMKKNVHEYVADKARVKQIDEVLKSVKQDQKAFTKKSFKPTSKQFDQLNLDYNATKEDFESILFPYFTQMEALQNEYIASELRIRSFITEPEWKNIMTAVVEKEEKEKSEKNINSLYTDLLNSAQEAITDPESKDEILAIANTYKSKTIAFTDLLVEMGYKHQEELRKYNAVASDFQPLRSKMLEQRKEYVHFIVEMRFKLKALATEEEWKKLSKEINKIIKNSHG